VRKNHIDNLTVSQQFDTGLVDLERERPLRKKPRLQAIFIFSFTESV
jgi:hypothetical protein